MNKILLVDDDPYILSALQRTLRHFMQGEELQIETFTNPLEALNRICECEFDLIISDYMMPQLNGAELLEALKEVAPDTVRIMLSASSDFDTMLSTINQAQAFRFMLKPWDRQALEQNVRLALQLRATLLVARDGVVELTAEQREGARLEAEEPGILTVRRDSDGAILM